MHLVLYFHFQDEMEMKRSELKLPQTELTDDTCERVDAKDADTPSTQALRTTTSKT